MKTEEVNVGTQVRFTHRIAALGLAIVTTAFIATSVAVVFTGGSSEAAGMMSSHFAAPLRTLLGN